MKKSLSIDIGGTKIQCIEYSIKFEVLNELRLQTKNYLKGEGITNLRNLFSFINSKFANSEFEKVGISINCAIKDNIVIYSSLLGGGEGINLHSLAKEFFKFNTFSSDNDVLCMTKAEVEFGKGKTYNNFLYINLGTGIRIVAVENNKILRGVNNLAGEVSPISIWVKEANKYISADNLLAGKGLKTLSKLVYGKELAPEEIFNGRNNEIVKLYATYLGEFLVNASYFYNPDAFVFGGSVIKAYKVWLPEVKKYYIEKLPKFLQVKDFVITDLNNPASIGALI